VGILVYPLFLQKIVQAIASATAAHILSVVEEDNEVKSDKSLPCKQNKSLQITSEYGHSRRQYY
jgi:hypothetical protein